MINYITYKNLIIYKKFNIGHYMREFYILVMDALRNHKENLS